MNDHLVNHLFTIRLVRACCRLIGLQLSPTSCLRVQSSASESMIEKGSVPRFVKRRLTLFIFSLLCFHFSWAGVIPIRVNENAWPPHLADEYDYYSIYKIPFLVTASPNAYCAGLNHPNVLMGFGAVNWTFRSEGQAVFDGYFAPEPSAIAPMCADDHPVGINPDGSKFSDGTSLYMESPSGFDPFRNLGSSCSPLINNGSNPINAATGNKYQQETDYWSQAGLLFRRNYNSLSTGTPFNKVWLTNFDRYVRLQTYSGSPSYGDVFVYKASGNIHVYKPNGGGGYIPEDVSSLDKLERLAGGGWRLKIASDDSVENYDVTGKILTISDRASRIQTLTYDLPAANGGDNDPDTLDIITDDTGRSLRFTYDTQKRIATITDPASGVILFGYDTQSNLISVTYPDGRSKTYHYNESENTAGVSYLTHALTGITDENGDRFATFTYDTRGLAITSTHAGGANRYSFTYNANRSSTVADPLGKERTYNFKFILGVANSTGQSQPGGSGCDAASSAMTYDVNGNIASKDDFNGNRTCYASDLSRNLEISRVEGLVNTQSCATVTPAASILPAGSRKVSTTWHPDWRLQTHLAEPGKMTTSVYNGQPDPFNGNTVASCAPLTAVLPDGKPITVLCRQVEQATTDTNGGLGFTAVLQVGVAKREQKWTYNQYGQILTHDGPRSDVSDVTTYTYYTDTNFTGVGSDAAGHTLGDLQNMTNAVGKVTQYTQYNKHGQLLQSIDPNGVVAAYTYDLRKRLLSTAVGGQTTSYTYDPVGQLTRITRPDASWLGYEYDAAHRQTAVLDNRGNRIEYTLDNDGNKIAEQVKDPGDALRRSLARSIDALGRVQQITGKE